MHPINPYTPLFQEKINLHTHPINPYTPLFQEKINLHTLINPYS